VAGIKGMAYVTRSNPMPLWEHGLFTTWIKNLIREGESKAKQALQKACP
jgi:hypothetical protein